MMKYLKRVFVAVLLFGLFVSGINPAYADAKEDKVLYDLVDNENIKARILWYDLTANIKNLNTKEKVKNIVNKTSRANINTIVLDVKHSGGFVSYKSKLSKHMSESKNPKTHGYDADYDLIEEVLKEAKKHDIQVHININTFSAGDNQFKEGPAFDNPEWQTIVYDGDAILKVGENLSRPISSFNSERGDNHLVIFTPDKYDVSPSNRWGIEVKIENGEITEINDRNVSDAPALEIPKNGFVVSAHGESRKWILDNLKKGQKAETAFDPVLKPISETTAPSAFMNPIHPEVQKYTWDVITELVENYDIDGITLDRARYHNLSTDFSELSRRKFEERIGEKVENFPEDIYKLEFENNSKKLVEGKLFNQWIEFRANNIKDYFEKTEELVHSINPDISFNTYVGSWHPLYHHEGVNWGSKNFKPDYDWATPTYNETGYLEHLDFLMTGLYYPDVMIDDLKGEKPYWYSVEGAADISMQATQGENFVYGAPFLLDFGNNPEGFKKALKVIDNKMHGIMLLI